VVQLREIQGSFLPGARGKVGRLRELRKLALGGVAAVALLEPRRAGAQVRGDGGRAFAARQAVMECPQIRADRAVRPG
jgi:hypothetical protein